MTLPYLYLTVKVIKSLKLPVLSECYTSTCPVLFVLQLFFVSFNYISESCAVSTTYTVTNETGSSFLSLCESRKKIVSMQAVMSVSQEMDTGPDGYNAKQTNSENPTTHSEITSCFSQQTFNASANNDDLGQQSNQNASVNYTSRINQKALVFCLEESLNECRNNVDFVDRPFKVKVFALSTTNDSKEGKVSVFMKEVVQGMILPTNSVTDSNESSKQFIPDSDTVSKSPASGLNKNQDLYKSGCNHSCRHCGKLFTRKVSVMRHIQRIHSSTETKLHCQTCSKSYKDRNSYKQHVRTKHNGIFRYTCKECGKGCNRLMDYKVHLSTHTGKKLFKCDICSEEFLWKHYLTVHKRKHAGDFPFHCDKCSAKFHDSSRLIHHKRTHEQCKELFKKHQCKFCKKKFEAKRDVDNHERTHTGDKPFSCTICDKAYTAKSSLKEHMKTHGEKALLCPVCKKGFHKTFILKEHMKVHTEEMPFVCQFCAKRYRYGSNLRVHEKSCTGKK